MSGMIDWYNLIGNSLWIVSLSLALSIVSIAVWEAAAEGKKLRKLLSTNRRLSVLTTAEILFCGGMVALADVLWERVLWLLLLIALCVQIVFRLLSAKTE
jgi:hypothetical protein